MTRRRLPVRKVLRSRPGQIMYELLVAPRRRQGRKADTVAFQWHDGAGELHYEVLSPAQSWPYLSQT